MPKRRNTKMKAHPNPSFEFPLTSRQAKVVQQFEAQDESLRLRGSGLDNTPVSIFRPSDDQERAVQVLVNGSLRILPQPARSSITIKEGLAWLGVTSDTTGRPENNVTQRDRHVVARVLTVIAARIEEGQFSTPVIAEQLNEIADALCLDYDGDPVEVLADAVEHYLHTHPEEAQEAACPHIDLAKVDAVTVHCPDGVYDLHWHEGQHGVRVDLNDCDDPNHDGAINIVPRSSNTFLMQPHLRASTRS